MDQEFILWKYIVYNFFRFCVVADCLTCPFLILFLSLFFDLQLPIALWYLFRLSWSICFTVPSNCFFLSLKFYSSISFSLAIGINSIFSYTIVLILLYTGSVLLALLCLFFVIMQFLDLCVFLIELFYVAINVVIASELLL